MSRKKQKIFGYVWFTIDGVAFKKSIQLNFWKILIPSESNNAGRRVVPIATARTGIAFLKTMDNVTVKIENKVMDKIRIDTIINTACDIDKFQFKS